jgi:hypothetical protein
MRNGLRSRWRPFNVAALAALAELSSLELLVPRALAQRAATAPPPSAVSTAEFPAELVNWRPRSDNPVFTGAGPGHWDAKIRERGWILHNGDGYLLWYTGYDGKRESRKLLGYATSPDGLRWTRSPKNPLVRDYWIEDMTVIHEGDTYYMFAEGKHANHTVMLTSTNGVDWKWEGELDIRMADGTTPAKRPGGTPAIWIEKGVWHLFYEWLDKGVWLAKTTKPRLRVWTNVQDDPVLVPGPAAYDKDMIAVNQVFKRDGAYFAIYHGSGSGDKVPRTWNTNIARSTDLAHWKKYAGNPIVDDNKSSGVVVPTSRGIRLYTMHDRIDVFEPRRNRSR